jgi:hypothetical protein
MIRSMEHDRPTSAYYAISAAPTPGTARTTSLEVIASAHPGFTTAFSSRESIMCGNKEVGDENPPVLLNHSSPEFVTVHGSLPSHLVVVIRWLTGNSDWLVVLLTLLPAI